jgi:hypothetical protein
VSYVVVLLTASACAEAPGDAPTRCVMEVLGPFDTRDDAEAAGHGYPVLATTHIMALRTLAEAW